MKTIKRFFLRIPYAFYWLWATYIGRRIFILPFNSWLTAHGFWRLTGYLKNLKVLIPNEYRDFVKANPKLPTYVIMKPADKSDNVFFHYEAFGELPEGSGGIIEQVEKNGKNISYDGNSKIDIDKIINSLKREKGPTELPPQ